MRLSTALLAVLFGIASTASADGPYCHLIVHNPCADSHQNGAELLDIVKNIKDASATNPYMIHLGAGTYTLPSSMTLLPYISIKGAGIASTILTPQNSSFVTTLFLQDQISPTYVQAPSNESVSNMTIVGIQPLSATVNGFLAIDHVQLLTTANLQSEIDLLTAGSHFLVTDSLLGTLELDSMLVTSSTPSAVSSFLSSQVDLIFEPAPYFNVVCMADYTSTGTAVPQACH
jgi:hypothetical protein